ncbi:hypothetical protein ACFLQL_02145 [Verrucomicrobiota bacterium]
MKIIINLHAYKIILISLGLAITLPLVAAADTGQINYQARLLDAYGRRVNATVDLSFKIYDAVTDGNLLWSETQAGIVVLDGVYTVVLGSLTAIPASVFAQNNVYLELVINDETMSPRQQITASAYSLVARTIMGSNVYENQTSGYVGIGTTNPAVKLDVSGAIQVTGFKMPTGGTVNYVLASDADGVGTWQPYSIVVTEHDPIHTNWVRVVYTPATNSIWSAIGSEATTRAADDVVLQNNIDTSSNALNTADVVLQNNINTASNALNTSVLLRMFRSGDIMTGPLTNTVGFFGQYFTGDGGGLTNIAASSVSLTGVVHRIGGVGSEMTGPLVVSNNATITGTNQVGVLYVTNAIILQDEAGITNWNQVGQTSIVASLQTSTGTLNTAVGDLNTSTGTLNTSVTTLNTATGTLNTATNTLNTSVIALNTATNDLSLATNSLNSRAVSWDSAVINKTGSAGDTIAYSNVYYYGVDGSWSNASASGSATARSLLGLALGGTISTDGMLLNGQCTNAWGFATGSILYLATNVNQITTTRPTGTNHIVRIVGYAVSASTIYFNPDRTYIEIVGE